MRFDWHFADAPAASLDRILEIWSDRAFYADLAERLQLVSHTVDIADGGQELRVDQRLGLSTAKIPQPFRGFVGDSLKVSWLSEWDRSDAEPSGRLTAHTDDNRLRFEAPTALRGGTSAEWAVDGKLEVNLPLVLRPARGQIEGSLRDVLTSVLRNQAKLTEQWLGR